MKKENTKKEVMNAPSNELSKELKSLYSKEVGVIKREIKKASTSYLNIGFALHKIQSTKAYEVGEYASVHEFASDVFDISKSSCYNFINIVEVFGEKVDGVLTGRIDDNYKDYNVSQLSLLLGYLSRGGRELDCFNAKMSVRELKKAIKEKESAHSDGKSSVKCISSDDLGGTVIYTCYNRAAYDSDVDKIDALILSLLARGRSFKIVEY